MTADTHEDFTRMLFVDAIVGVGFPDPQAAAEAFRGELARKNVVELRGGPVVQYVWHRSALDSLSTDKLQDLYHQLKMYEVTHAS